MADDEKARAKAAAAAERAAARAAAAAAKAAEKAAAKAAKAAQAEIERKIAAATLEWNRAISAANAVVVRKCQEARDEWHAAAQRLSDDGLWEHEGFRMKAMSDIEKAKLDAAWDEWGAAKDAADEAFKASTGGCGAPQSHPEWERDGRPDTP